MGGSMCGFLIIYSSCHAAMPDYGLNVKCMNVKPRGKQRVMRYGLYNCKVQKMNFSLGVPKGLHCVLEVRGIDTKGKGISELREIHPQHDDIPVTCYTCTCIKNFTNLEAHGLVHYTTFYCY